MAEEAEWNPYEDVQILLEVTYENFRVTKIRNVSEEGAAYFAEHYSDEYIRSRLAMRPDLWPAKEPARDSARRKRAAPVKKKIKGTNQRRSAKSGL